MMRALLRSFSLDYVSRLLQFALRQHPFLVANVLLALLSVLLELAAIASLLPLSTIAAGGELGADSIWRKAFALVGVEVSFAGLVLYFVFLFATRLLSNFVNQTTSIFIGKRVQAELSSRAFQKLVKEMSLRDIDSRSAGHFISLAGDETARAGAILISLNQALAALLLASVYLAAIFLFSAWLGLGITAFVAIALLSLRGTLRRSQALSSRQLGEAKVAHSVFLDALNGLRSVRALSAEDFVTSRYDGIIKQYTRTHFHIDTLAFAARLIPALILLCCVAFAAAGGYLMVASPAGLAAILTGLALLLRFVPAAGQVLTLSMRLLADLRAASDVTHLLDAPTASAAHAKRKLERSIEVLELRQVSFAYKAARPVLRGFSAQFRRGHVYALVGPSGSGKTTVLDLLLGFYPPDAGEVLVNGISADAVEPASLRARVILVGQQVTILNDSIANNIRFGRPASDDEVKRACAAACIHDYIAAQPQGYETLLSYQGSNLSGGQRQRIAIARALLREPDILLLDESTSGLDAETRDRVVGNIIDLYRPRIVIFATHDPALIQGVDQVVSLEQTAESLRPASVAAAATRPK